MDRKELAKTLRKLAAGELTVREAEARLSGLAGPVVAPRSAPPVRHDRSREIRTGVPEVVFGEKKSLRTLDALLARVAAERGRLLMTRLSPEIGAELDRRHDFARHDPLSRTLVAGAPRRPAGRTLAIVSAGSTDVPVAEEAAVTATFLGLRVARHYDVGVAGLHRLIGRLPSIRRAGAVIVVAGMEGALPSVVAGLVARPVIAVPTSIGYGASFEGLAALLGMLSSCAPGVVVVNIDNGFGAAAAAAKILRTA